MLCLPMRRSLAIAAACLSLALVACSPVEKKKKNKVATEQQATVDVCDQLIKVGAALEVSANLQPTSTVGEATAADRALASALAGLEKAEQTLEQLRLKNFQTQLQAFKADVAKVASNKGQTLEQAAQQLKTKAEPVIAARRQLSAAVKCEEPAAAAPAAPAKP